MQYIGSGSSLACSASRARPRAYDSNPRASWRTHGTIGLPSPAASPDDDAPLVHCNSGRGGTWEAIAWECASANAGW